MDYFWFSGEWLRRGNGIYRPEQAVMGAAIAVGEAELRNMNQHGFSRA